jgi:hypothetical protein
MQYDKDLVAVVPDKNALFLLDGILAKTGALGLRAPTFQIDAHPLRDQGCLDADEFLQSQVTHYAHAIVIVADREQSGRREMSPHDIEAEIEAKLAKSGWERRARAVVVDPGIGRWLLDHEFGEKWGPEGPDLRRKIQAALRRRRVPQSPELYRTLGARLVVEGEPDPAWQKLLATFKDWFGVAPTAAQPDSEAVLQGRFDALVGKWSEDTRLMSSLREIVGHSAYQEIIAMGTRAIPLILRDLERQPKHWGPALRAITGASPVPKEHAGMVEKIAEDWLQWAKENGYAW